MKILQRNWLGPESAFAGALLDLSAAAPDAQRLDAEEKQEAVAELINAYRIRGHLFANIDSRSFSR